MEYRLSKHAADALREREIRLEWVSAVLDNPSLSLPDPEDTCLTHALKPIPEFDGRVLRVIYNHTKQPVHIVTTYFDRTMKGKL